MKKKLTCLLLLFCLPFFSIGQTSWNIPLALYNKVVRLNPATPIGILVEGNPVEIANAAKKHGGFLRYNQGTICSVQILAGELVSFSKEPGIIQIGNTPIKMQPLNDTSKVQSRVNQVHAGMAPLSQAYHGENIIMGMIDSGIDFNHPDFKDANGKTRILNIWDQRDNTGPGPSPWNYGTLWDSAQINAGVCTHNDLQYFGHGTHTSGIAAGNGQSVTAVDYSGVATKSDIIMVALDFNGVNSPVAIADAAAYIYARAQALGRPCVINASVGDYYGSHDGQDLQALMIDSLLDVSGRSFVCAVGNAGNLKMHLSYTLSSDTNITWFSSTSGIYIQLWADTNNFNNAKMAIGCVQDGNFIDRGRTPFSNIQSNLGILTTDTIRNSAGQEMAVVQKFGSIQGSAYSMEFYILPDSTTGYDYSSMLTGSGLFHCWSFDLYGNPLPSAGVYPNIIYYKQPDSLYTVCSGFTCSNRTICVGNYVNRSSWMNYNNQRFYDTTVVAGEIMYNSSVGPTRDGRTKPDITAPGANVISCGVLSSMPAIIAGASQYVGVGGFHLADGGSSASSPQVAGSADLWLQQFPNATWQDVKNAVEFCARIDSFTGTALPDNTWGFGKLDAFAMMTNCALATHEETITNENQFHLFPNPINTGMDFQLYFGVMNSSTTMELFSVNGDLLFSKQIQKGENSVVIPGHLLSSGMYFVKMTDTNSSRTEKLVVE